MAKRGLCRAWLGVIGFVIATASATGQVQQAVPVKAAPSALLTIDQNRAAVVERIVGEWGDALAKANLGMDASQLRLMLEAMRADHLLAASLAGNLEGLRNVIANAITSTADVKPGLLHAKALGDTSDDVVYTPLTPCRILETRGTFLAVYQGDGTPAHNPVPFGPNEVRNYTLQGGNGSCLSQLPAGLNPAAVQLQVFGIPISPSASGDVEMLPQAATFGSTTTLVYLGIVPFTSASATVRANLANNQIGVQVRGPGAHLAVDVVGYFKVPGGPIGTVSNIATGTGLTGGPITATGTVSLASSYQLPQSCTNGQVPKSNGAGGWTCAADATGGTVTSVGTGGGLTGGPITAAGTINLAATNLLPTTPCATDQIPKWNGSAWSCAAQAGGSGTVTSVGTGGGLTGGPITAAGTINLAATNLMPTTPCATDQIPKWNGSAWVCAADATGGTVTSVGTGGGLTGGPITAAGTINLATTNLLPTTPCATNQIPKWNGSAWACAADAGGSGTVTSVGTGTGLTGGPITGSGTIGIANGGVGTAQIATNAVTQATLSATGASSGQVLSTDGTNLVWQPLPQIVHWNDSGPFLTGTNVDFVFLSAGATVTVPAGTSRRITASGYADLYVLSGSPSISLNICYMNTLGSAVNQFTAASFLYPMVTPTVSVFSMGDSVVLSSGTYKIGLCIANANPNTIYAQRTAGWVMLTNS